MAKVRQDGKEPLRCPGCGEVVDFDLLDERPPQYHTCGEQLVFSDPMEIKPTTSLVA